MSFFNGFVMDIIPSCAAVVNRVMRRKEHRIFRAAIAFHPLPCYDTSRIIPADITAREACKMTCTPRLLFRETFAALNAGGYVEYRIPGIVVTAQGTLIACCEGRMATNDDWARIDTLICRRGQNESAWTRTVIALPASMGGTDNDCTNNPTLIADGDLIHLIFQQNYARAFHCVSQDDGRTWSQPVEITDTFRAFPMAWNVCATGPGHGLRLRSGRLIAPVWLADGKRIDDRRIAHQPSCAGCIWSDDHGKTWHAGALAEGVADANETCIAELPDGRVLFNIRNREADLHRRVAVSADGGQTLYDIVRCDDLPCPQCFAGMAVLPDGSVAYAGCINNGDVTPADPRGRINAAVCVSSDAGQTWQKLIHIDDIGGYCDIAVHDNRLYVLYEQTVRGKIARMMLACYELT